VAVAPIEVIDPDDPRLVDYRDLTDAQLRRDRREVESPDGRFIVEGHLAVAKLLASPYPIVSLLIADTQWPRVAPLLDAPAQFPCFVATRTVLDATVGFRLHRGLVASARRLPAREPAALLHGARTVAVMEGINDHENLGGLFRNAAAFGVDAVLLDPTCADPLYRRSVRVSLGHALTVPFARFSRDGWPAAPAAFADRGFITLALTPAADATPLDSVRLAPDARVAVLLGAEGPGLRPTTLAAADQRVRIPLAHGVDSLNVSVAAAIALHHVARLTHY
jgi:tRNA G18 (ribose-2'-O)-methylase SpoU